MSEHQLKTWPEYFEAVRCGDKTFEVRKNDRDYKAGDTLVLQEFDPDTKSYTGRELRHRVTYLLDNDYCRDGYVIMALSRDGEVVEP